MGGPKGVWNNFSNYQLIEFHIKLATIIIIINIDKSKTHKKIPQNPLDEI